MNGPVIAALVTGFFGMVSGLVAAVLSSRATRRTAEVGQAAAVFESYGELVDRLEGDVTRLKGELGDERAARLRERREYLTDLSTCRRQIRDLTLALSTLRSVVLDEVARTAADAVLDEHADVVEEAHELDQIRTFLGHMAPEEGDPAA